MATILVVDDDILIRIMVKRELEKLNFHIITANDGVSAWEKINFNQPDLVITDLNMPNLGGLGLLERIRGSDKFQELPVICITGEKESTLKKKAGKLGATGWIKKPFHPETWGKTLNKILN